MFIPKKVRSFFGSPWKKVSSSWQKLNAYQKWHSFYNFVSFFGQETQFEIFTKRPNGPITLLSSVVCIFSSFLIIYTTFYYIYTGELARIIPVYCMLGIMASSYAAGWNLILRSRYKWIPLLEMSGKYIYQNDNRATDYNRICSECTDEMLKSYIVTVAVIMLSFAGALIGPIRAYLQDGSLVTLYETRVPFLQDQPRTEFIVNVMWQGYISIAGIPALFIIEGMTAIVNNTITVSSKLTVNEFEELSDELESDTIGKDECACKVMRIFTQIIYMDDYIQSFRDVWYWRLFLSPPTFLFSISISIYSQFVLGFPAGYGIAVVSYIQMVVLCVTGQNVVDRNNRLLEALYDFKWYFLPAEYQKDVLFMIQHLQNKEGLTIGPFEQLNFETLKILTQKVYSFLMFLLSFNV